ncbi:MAG TPA: 50S ribosomal protein L21 [Sphingomicrobium sp.]
MFAVVRTGGKQYRVHPGDKIVVEKLDGNAGDKVTLGDVLLAGDGGSLKSTDGLKVAAEIIAQAKGDKVTVFKKRRRHNYRRKQGHRQQHTILKIVAIGDHKEDKKAAPKAGAAPKTEGAPKSEAAPKAAADKKPAAVAKEKAEAETAQHQAGDVAGTPTENPAPNNEEAAGAPKPAAKKAAAPKAKAEKPSTENAAPAKAAAKKTPKKK